jgi:outer membrane protein OmpA-like peptidoglycan-associated protein
MKHFLPCCLALLLCACSGSLEKLQEQKPTGGDFSSALAAEYMGFAESEKDLGHSYQSNYYAQKGLRALDGNTVLPEDIKNELKATEKAELGEARKQLMALLNDEMKHVSPQRLARTQLLFDCWQHQLVTRSGGQIAPCADEFATTLQEMQDLADSFVTGDETTQSVSFGRKSLELTPAAGKTLDKAVARAKGFKRYMFRIDGHIDMQVKGTQSYELTAQRMEAVRKALVMRGVADEKIEVLRDKVRTHLTPVVLSSDEPQKPRSIDITLRTYSAGEKIE